MRGQVLEGPFLFAVSVRGFYVEEASGAHLPEHCAVVAEEFGFAGGGLQAGDLGEGDGGVGGY